MLKLDMKPKMALRRAILEKYANPKHLDVWIIAAWANVTSANTRKTMRNKIDTCLSYYHDSKSFHEGLNIESQFNIDMFCTMIAIVLPREARSEWEKKLSSRADNLPDVEAAYELATKILGRISENYL